MENNKIIKLFKLAAELLELHDENPFKVRSYANAVAALENVEEPLAGKSQAELESISGVGKSIAARIADITQTGSFAELNQLLSITPPGVVEMLGIKGIGPKKVRTIWKELGAETTAALLDACQQDKLSKVKGFGAKTQETIKQSLLFNQQSQGKQLYAEAAAMAAQLLEMLQKQLPEATITTTGALRRKLEVIEQVQFVVGSPAPLQVQAALDALPVLQKEPARSGPFAWRGTEKATGLRLEVKIVPPAQLATEVFLQSAAPEHLVLPYADNKTLLALAREQAYNSEEEIYAAAGMAYVEPELREGTTELQLALAHQLPQLLVYEDLCGSLHNHTTYSDGAHTLEQMATYCRDMGLAYLGMADHSKSAFYANGLSEERVAQQHREIDELNKKLAPFKIFKGIESDILNDGSLDYDDTVLASFDFVVASIHSNLNMDESKATARLIKAIENPYTTILGHPTGRLLLRREGYPINHKAVIDACAANGVIIEINANPWRLDLDWRWVHYALEQGVMLSINPDAHHTSGFHDMHYGVLAGRKGGLTKEMTFNARTAAEVEAYFKKRKESKSR